MNKIDKRESFVICIGKDDCPWCARAVPVLYQTAEEMDVTVEYIDLLDDYSCAPKIKLKHLTAL